MRSPIDRESRTENLKLFSYPALGMNSSSGDLIRMFFNFLDQCHTMQSIHPLSLEPCSMISKQSIGKDNLGRDSENHENSQVEGARSHLATHCV